jgi:hypothetical protein
MEKREVKFIRALQKHNIAWSYYSLNDDMCAPGVIENIDVSKGGEAPLYLPNNLQRNYEYDINELAGARNTSQIPNSVICPR